MTCRYEAGSTVYIVESQRFVRSAIILSYSGGLYKIRFTDHGGSVVRESRLFETEEAAKASFHKWNYLGQLQ